MKRKIVPLSSAWLHSFDRHFYNFAQSNQDNPICERLVSEGWVSDAAFIGFCEEDPKQLAFTDLNLLTKTGEVHGFGTNEFFEGVLDSSKRQNIRAAKLVKRLFPDEEFSNTALEEFTNLVIAMKGGMGNFELVDGHYIQKYYDEDNYTRQDRGGMLYDSCMKYDTCAPFLEIYVDHCQMLVLFDDEYFVKGRALVWPHTTIKSGGDVWESITFMDRIYTVDDSDVIKFKKYAKNRGWAFRKSRNAGEDTTFRVPMNGEYCTRDCSIVVDAKRTDYDYWPYADTLRYLNEDDTFSNNDYDARLKMNDTEGGAEWYNSDEDW